VPSLFSPSYPASLSRNQRLPRMLEARGLEFELGAARSSKRESEVIR
jgi:hypothetical protein